MSSSAENLKSVMEYFGINNKQLATALDVDPSYVSRWVTGKRRLLASSPPMEALAEYILSRSKRVHDMEWLKAQFSAAGLPSDSTSVYRTKHNLIIWLASDGERLLHNLGNVPAPLAHKPQQQKKTTAVESGSSTVSIGCLAISFALKPLLCGMAQNGAIDIFMSSDRLSTIVNEDIATLIQKTAEQNNLRIRMAVCVSGDTQAMARLIDAYMAVLISGHVQLYLVHGVTQTVTNQLHLIVPKHTAVLVTETPGSAAPPVATFVTDAAFVAEAQKSFDASFRYAQSALSIYDDAYTRDVIEILAMEYCTPNPLDVIKDSINPMFMSTAAYNRFLGTRGHSEPEFAWRSAEFVRFKTGMDANLHNGTAFREIISLARLNDIARRGSCRMAGLYFAELGYVDLDAQGCMDIINGYIEYLENELNFSLLILDDLDELHGNNCWHIKRDAHISINNWQGNEPVMIYSDQLMLLREFQARYDALWEKGAGAVGNRANVISILRDVAGRME